ncbi:Gldg family protein [Thalassotalea fusca]
MQLNQSASVNTFRIAQKEIALFFSSPVAYLFLGAFVAVTLFIFFWGEAFFSRNIADVRPMFEWMPILLVFLCSTLTMRLWSEERRSGTIEFVHTLSVPLWHFVLGKFVGCLALLCIALAVTLPLPITVSILGDLDWGPVISGYLAVLLLGAAYLSIGLAVSAKSDNQIVSLITACAICGLFYFIGAPAITDFFGHQTAEFLRQLGTGARFEDITRGVIDVRDLYYYLSLVLVFLALNTFFLEQERWVTNRGNNHHKHWRMLVGLFAANALVANLWLGQLPQLRWDTTEGQQYSISDATKNYLNQLQEPMLIRGYFSQKTHPLLAPLVPQVKDLLEEYAIAGNGKVRVEFIDPQQSPELEKEANNQFGIKPLPFQVADRYQSSIVSSYFNVLVQYGDEHQILGFRDLIEVSARAESDVDVMLRNPEHDITRAIKTVLQHYQTAGNLFDTVKQPLTFKGYLSQDEKLPEQLSAFKKVVTEALKKVQGKANGKLTVEIIDPDDNDGQVAKKIAEDYGFQPMSANLFSDQRFYFYLTLASSEQIVQIPLDDMTKGTFERNLDAAIKRFATGFTKNLALVMPASTPYGYGMPSAQFTQLERMLGAELNVKREDLTDGLVSGETDILMLVSPKSLTEAELFAVDQFLMKGGTVIAATSPYSVNLSNQSLSMSPVDSGLQDWLTHHGLTVEDALVMDPNNSAFPIPVTRNVGGFQIREMRMLNYPYFIDVRTGLNKEHLVTAELPQLTMNWASPISVSDRHQDIQFTPLLKSSDQAWLSKSLDVMPRVDKLGETSYLSEGETGEQILGVIAQGRFTSYFNSKPESLVASVEKNVADDTGTEKANDSGVATNAESTTDEANEADKAPEFDITSVVTRSTDSARIILFSSNDFLNDQILQLTGGVTQDQYLNSIQLMMNAIDWSLEDSALMSIRSRGNFNRTLPPMEHSDQLFWEYTNYVLALFTLAAITFWANQRRKRKQRQFMTWLAN